jgi:putative copper resistance protein D
VHVLRRDRQLSLAAKAFGRIAVWVFVAVGIAGAANAYARLAAFSDLWTSGYGRLVVVKLLLLFALLGCAALARKRVLPGLDGDHALAAFVRLAAIEILLMAAAVASGVALTTTAPTHHSRLAPEGSIAAAIQVGRVGNVPITIREMQAVVGGA